MRPVFPTCFLVAFPIACSDAIAAPFAVPHVDLDAIDARTTKTALKTTGAVAVAVPGLAQASATAFEGLADCLEGDGQEALLVDGTRGGQHAAEPVLILCASTTRHQMY